MPARSVDLTDAPVWRRPLYTLTRVGTSRVTLSRWSFGHVSISASASYLAVGRNRSIRLERKRDHHVDEDARVFLSPWRSPRYEEESAKYVTERISFRCWVCFHRYIWSTKTWKTRVYSLRKVNVSFRNAQRFECSSPWILFRRTMNWQVVDGEWLYNIHRVTTHNRGREIPELFDRYRNTRLYTHAKGISIFFARWISSSFNHFRWVRVVSSILSDGEHELSSDSDS